MILYYQSLLFILKVIKIEIFSYYYNIFVINHFEIKKTYKFFTKKYY